MNLPPVLDSASGNNLRLVRLGAHSAHSVQDC